MKSSHGTVPNPKGILTQSPGLRGTSNPGSPSGRGSTSRRLWPKGGLDFQPGAWCNGRNSVGVKLRGGFPPQVARSSQPGAGGRNPFGIRSGSMRSAHDPAKDSCCRTADHTRSRDSSSIQLPLTFCRISCAPTHARQERGIHAAEQPTTPDPGTRPRSSYLAHSAA